MSDHDDELHACSDYSLFGPESLQQIRDRLEDIDATECDCDELPHSNALHDLAHDDVPALLRFVEHLQGEVEKWRAQTELRAQVSVRLAVQAGALQEALNQARAVAYEVIATADRGRYTSAKATAQRVLRALDTDPLTRDQ